jgi:hypothetical protein
MPTYCYINDKTGHRVELQARMGCAPQQVWCCGLTYRRDIAAEHADQISGDPWVNHSSLALSVHPADVMEHRREIAAKGLNAKVRDDGYFEFASRSDQKKYCRAYGYVNFGDVW